MKSTLHSCLARLTDDRRFRPRRRWLCLVALACLPLFALPTAAWAARTADELVAALDAEGFENLSVVEDAGRRELRIAFEDRRYRWEVTGIGAVLAMAAADYDGRLIVTPLHTGIPMARIEVDAAAYRDFVSGRATEDESFARMDISGGGEVPGGPRRNRSYGKVDVTFSPGVRLNLVTPAPRGALHGGEFQAIPGIYAQVIRGVAVEGAYTQPLSESKPVVSRAAATFNARLGSQSYLQAQAGRLAGNLNGAAAQVVFVSRDGRHLGGAVASRARFIGLQRHASYHAFYSWRPSRLDIVGSVAVGRYLVGDTGYSVTLTSGFGERVLEFFGTRTSRGRVFGMAFRTPLGAKRHVQPAAVRLRFQNSFRFVYTDRTIPSGGGLAVPFSDGFQLATRRLNRAYLRAYARQLREAGSRWLPADSTQPGE